MPSDSKTLYPMLGVGAFMTMFLAGIVLAHEIGLACTALVAVGLLSACLGAVLVSDLERRDRTGERPRAAPRHAVPCVPAARTMSPVAAPRRPRWRWRALCGSVCDLPPAAAGSRVRCP